MPKAPFDQIAGNCCVARDGLDEGSGPATSQALTAGVHGARLYWRKLAGVIGRVVGRPGDFMMWLRFAFGVAICFQAACLITAAQAQDSGLECDAFMKNADGSWTVIQKAYIPGPNIRVEEGAVFRPGGTFLGDDLAARLDRTCPNAPVSTPAAVQAGKVPLSAHADPNGNIDVRQLTCAHLDDASGEETDLVLAWYGGWYSALAKKRGFNLVRLRSVINNVVDYCKANPGKNLAQVVDLMLR